MTAAEWLALVAERAAQLRAAGVRKVECGELRLELDPYDGGPVMSSKAPDEDGIDPVRVIEDPDPLNDPSTFAMPDGSVPGFKRSRTEELE